MKAMTVDKSFAEKKDTCANLIANLSRMVLTTSERLFYIKLLTRGFRSTPTCILMYSEFQAPCSLDPEALPGGSCYWGMASLQAHQHVSPCRIVPQSLPSSSSSSLTSPAICTNHICRHISFRYLETISTKNFIL